MIETWLVQRLLPAPKSEKAALVTQVFGGGMLGLRPEGWKAVQQVFDIDYMGSAEYEFGTIPKCLKELAEDAENLVATSIVVPVKNIEPNYNRQLAARTKAGKPKKRQPVHPAITDHVVYVLCRKDHLEGAEERIQRLAGNKIRTKGGTQFPRALDPIGEEYIKTNGWLELDNGFLFFLDKDMWRATTVLFTGKDPVDPPQPGA